MQRLNVTMFLLAATMGGCGGNSAATSEAPAQQVYFDSATKQPFVADASPDTPAVHPTTGHRTLMPALYCRQCKTWRAAPPLQELQRNPEARKCPKCKGALTADGPLPDAAP